MKKLLVILFSVISVAAYSQIPTGLPTAFNNQWYRFNRYMTVDSLFGLPYRDTNFVAFRAGALVTRPADSLVYRSTGKTSGKKWDLVGTGGSFGVYTAGNGLSLSSNTFRADTSSVGVATRNRLYKVADSLSIIISGAVPQTTSVNANYGLSGGGELTTNVSIATDTTLISTRAWRNKARDSVQANLNAGLALKMNLSDSSLYASRGRLYKVADSLGSVIASLTPDTITLSTRAWRQKGLDSIKFAQNTWSAKQTFTDSIVTVNQRLSGSLRFFNNATLTHNSQGLTTSQNWNDGTVSTGFFVDVTSTSTAAQSQLLNIRYNGTSFFNLDIYGNSNIIGALGANSFVKSGGTSSQLLAADGSVVTAGTGVTISGGTISASVVDTVTLSTRAWRQKGVDSVISVLGSRVSGTTNTLSVFTSSTTLGNSALSQTSTVMTLASRKLDITLPTDTSIVGTLVGTGTNVGAQWVFKNDYNTTGGFVGIAAGETSGDMVLAVGANKKLVFGLGTAGNSRGAEFSENALKIFQTAGGTSNWVTLGSLTGTQTWLFGSVTTTTGLTLKTTEYVNVNINGVAYKLAVVN